MRVTRMIWIAGLALTACNNQGRRYDPFHRLAQPAETAEKKTSAPNAEAKAGTPAAPAVTDSSPALPTEDVTDRKWCSVRKEGFTYVVDRFVFGGGPDSPTHLEKLAFPAGAAPTVRAGVPQPRWSPADAGDAQLQVTPLDSAAARATPAFREQAILFDEMVSVTKVSVDADSLATDGALRVVRPGQPELILFDCQNYSDDFVALEIKDKSEPTIKEAGAPAEENLAPPAPPRPPVTPAERGSASALRGSLEALDAKSTKLAGTSWCSYKNVQDDVIIGLLRINDLKLTLDHVRASALKAAPLDRVGFHKASIGKPIRGSFKMNESGFITNARSSFRLVEDQDGTRALINDHLTGAAAPASTAEVFFACDADHSPIEDSKVLENVSGLFKLIALRR